ncbi:glycoside hydrolase family 72 protein [Hypoxylon sp. FL1150]|nr:glycoside hydrolase family 72 protein [Hypoxylon sp. FL1150]
MGEVVTPVTVGGRYFWTGDKRFIVNGVIYDLGKIKQDRSRIYQDPLADDQLQTIQRSIPLLKELGINTLFIYYIDETKSHDAAMSMLAKAGIYVLPCLCGQGREMSCYTPSATYTSQLLASSFRTVDVMSQYDNTLGFIIANEWIDCLRVTSAAPYLRALTRDVKKYMALMSKLGQRVLPVGISAADITYLLATQFRYFSAGNKEEAIDFFAFSNYNSVGEWSMLKLSSGDSTPLSDMFSSAHIPVFFSRYGNGDEAPARSYFDTRAVYVKSEMLRVFSGGVVGEFFRSHHQGRGLVRVSASGSGHIRKLDDFNALKAALAQFFPPRLDQFSKPAPKDESPCGEEGYAVVGRRGCGTPAIVATTSGTVEARPQMPRRTDEWKASHTLPASPFDWGRLEASVEEKILDSEWTDLKSERQSEELDQAIEDLTFGIRDKLIIDDNVTTGSACNDGRRSCKNGNENTCHVI